MATSKRAKAKLNPVETCEKPSDLIYMALKDLSTVEKDEKYEISMWIWHATKYDYNTDKDFCFVCFAGAVMARTLGANITEALVPRDFNGTGVTDYRLVSLDLLRIGDIVGFICCFYSDYDDPKNYCWLKTQPYWGKLTKKFKILSEFNYIKITDYHEDGGETKFKKDMESIADKFKSIGL